MFKRPLTYVAIVLGITGIINLLIFGLGYGGDKSSEGAGRVIPELLGSSVLIFLAGTILGYLWGQGKPWLCSEAELHHLAMGDDHNIVSRCGSDLRYYDRSLYVIYHRRGFEDLPLFLSVRDSKNSRQD